jgi:hypothetical protein
MDPIEELKEAERKKEIIKMYEKHLEEYSKQKKGRLGKNSVKLITDNSIIPQKLFHANIKKTENQ